MVITGTRPTWWKRSSKPRIAGYPGARARQRRHDAFAYPDGQRRRGPHYGAGTNDSHSQRMWGTLGAFTIGHGGVRLRLGASGGSPMMNVNTEWEGLGQLAAKCGHGGGDFWTLYYFAREILFGEKGPFDIYGGCDVTIPGIQALRSQCEGGKPMEVPDFRKKADRDRFRPTTGSRAVRHQARRVGGSPLTRKPTGSARS